jgi:GNAT superfamily N-acetyltransferase
MVMRVLPAAPDRLSAWRAIHNAIIPTDPLTEEQVEERATRHILTVAYDDETLVGCATVRPPTEASSVSTVIVRILPAFRRQGLGSSYLAHALATARALEAHRIETVVLATNEDGLRFAVARGFVEHDRYTLEGHSVPFVDLHLRDGREP